MLQEIDRELIELLGKKIALLRRQNPPHSSPTELLSQAGVPEFVWRNLTLNCVAASQIAHPSLTKPRKVTVIGGEGKMGRFFVEQLAAAGHRVNILERDDWEDAPKLLGKADLVLICTPIEHTVNAIAKASAYLSPSTVLADISSCKTDIVSSMLEHHSGAVLSLHPMFGPNTRSLLSQNIIVCPGRKIESGQWFLDFMTNKGGKIVFCTPQEHDKMMAIVQAMRHFVTFSLGVFLAEEGIDLKHSLKFTTPLYRLQLDLVNRLFASDSSLSLHLMLCEPKRRQTIARLAATYNRLADLVAQEDRETLKQEFDATSNCLGNEGDRALQESDYLLESLSIFLAAQESDKHIHKNHTNANLAA
jgi:prephenate dehydrogenase